MTASPFVVQVARLRQSVGSRSHEQISGPIAGLEVTGSCVPKVQRSPSTSSWSRFRAGSRPTARSKRPGRANAGDAWR